jgi:hypothetical protein
MFGSVGGARGALVAPVVVVAVVAGLAALVVPLLGMALAGSGHRIRIWRRRRSAASVERRARAMMSEMCPAGWQAHITVQGEVPATRVAVDWAELSDDGERPVVSRRVWGETIDEALDAMVVDRRTDLTLERIERDAVAHGAHWPE